MNKIAIQLILPPEEEAFYKEKNGKRLRAEWRLCETCNKWFASRLNHGTYSKYCSLECSRRRSTEKFYTEISCNQCGKIFKKRSKEIEKRLNNNKTNLLFCSRECKDKAQRLSGDFPEMLPPQYGTVYENSDYRATAFRLNPVRCVDCEIKNEIFLQVHHIDGDRLNNNISNLEIVCPNHHLVRHMKEIGGVWVIDSKELTPRTLISELIVTLGIK